jgi:tripeptidyl-peptidase-1
VRVLSFPFIQSFSPTWFSTYPCPSHSAGRVCSSILLTLYQPLTFIGYSFPFSQAYPDVSAQSRRFLIYFQGLAGLISGTSAAAPTFAGIVSLLNDANLAAGKPPLGFLNPMLYSIGVGGLNDITQGNAPGCGTPGFNVRSLISFFSDGVDVSG